MGRVGSASRSTIKGNNMNHSTQTPTPEPLGTLNARLDRRDELFNRLKPACDKLGGCAEIKGGYYIVDSSKYNISPR